MSKKIKPKKKGKKSELLVSYIISYTLVGLRNSAQQRSNMEFDDDLFDVFSESTPKAKRKMV